MTIKEFLEKKDNVCPLEVTNGKVTSVKELYANYIVKYIPEEEEITEAIIKWHKLLVEYCKREDAIFLSRLYESKKNSRKEWDNRRGAYTEVESNGNIFRYAFASNNFSRLIFTMAVNGFVPDIEDFAKMLTEKEISLYSIYGTTKIENEISAYRTKVYDKVFYTPEWYLAHIISVNDDIYFNHDDIDLEAVFELGDSSEWKREDLNGCMIRRKRRIISEREREVAVAHFLRFVDPINYFVVPGVYHTVYRKITEDEKSPLGENQKVVSYMREKNYERYSTVFEDFLNRALVDKALFGRENLSDKEKEALDVTFFSEKISKKTRSTDGITEKKSKESSNRKSYSEEQRLEVVYYFLTNNDSLRSIEKEIFNISSSGSIAKKILDSLGVPSSKKGILLVSNIDDEIKYASNEKYKDTLCKVKAKYGI